MSQGVGAVPRQRVFTGELLLFFLNCIKKRAHVLENGSRSKDSFVLTSKALAWEDIKDQLCKRYSYDWEVRQLKRKWTKLKGEAKRRLRAALTKGNALRFSEWLTTALDILGIDVDSAVNLPMEELEQSLHIEQEVDQEGDSEMNESDDLDKDMWLGDEVMEDPPTPPAVVCELLSSDYDNSSLEKVSSRPGHFHSLASTSTSEPKVNGVAIEEERGFRKQLYEETLARLREEHKLKMDVLKVQYEEERVRLDILKIQREEAQKRLEASKNEKSSSEQWHSELRNNNEDFNNCPIIE